VVKPNAGLPDPVTGEYLVDPAEFAQAVVKFAQLGVTVYGGCCGTTPEHIKAAYDLLEEAEIPRRENIEIPAAVCSASEVVLIDQPRIIGERINPTGKKRFKAALQANDMDYILDQAVQQVDAGADLLDVNVGMPGIDEKGMMIRTVKALQSIGGLGKVDVDGVELEPFGADALTVNGYLGTDGIQPLLDVCEKYDKGIFVLAKTSNPVRCRT